MMKRMICCLLAVLLLLGMVGCAGKTEVDGTKPGETTGATEPADPTEEVTEPGVTDPTEEVTEPGAAGDVTEPEVTEAPTQDATEAPTQDATEAPTQDATEAPAQDATEAPTEGATEAPTQDATEAPSEETVEDPTEAPTEAPTEPEVTEATEAAPSEPEVTDPGEVELPAVPTVPATEAPVEPTVPATEAPTEAPTEPTSPATTEPAVTEPPATEPPATEPPATEHTHTYSPKVVKPTCTKKGYTKYTCDCGESYKDTYTEKLEHSYSSKVVKPTCEKKGYTLYTCDCGESYKDNYTATGEHDYVLTETKEPEMPLEGYRKYTCSGCGDYHEEMIYPTEAEKLAWCREVAKAAVKYINQFRVAQGDTEAQILPGLTLVAEYRSVQLLDNFEHSLKDLREAYAYYKYGEWVDATEYGDDAKYSYYTANAKEAIAYTGMSTDTDWLGKHIASVFCHSKNHWAYLGSSKYPYIGVGISINLVTNEVFTCTLQTSENYG